MKNAALPGTPRELWTALTNICPAFAGACTAQELDELEHAGAATFHFILQPFTQYFGANQSTLSQLQLRQLADLINRAVEEPDELENAVATCFLEHLHQVRGYKTLAPLLSPLAKRKTRA